jgi:hypothetical protein
LLISITSAGRLAEFRPPPYFILIERSLRYEGTSYHYLPPAESVKPIQGWWPTTALATIAGDGRRRGTWK